MMDISWHAAVGRMCYLDARNPETGEIISTAREDGKASGVELPEEMFHIKETEAGKLAMETDGYVKKLVWRKWNTNYLEELVEQVLSKQ